MPAGNASYSYRKFDHQMLVRNLAVSVKDKITDKWDYFDVKATLPENEESLVVLARAAGSIPVATGERLTSRWEFKRVLDSGAVDIVQPD